MGFMHYKTRGQSTPQGKQHVFFSAHPIDQEKYFEELSNEILKVINCAIWYEDDTIEQNAKHAVENDHLKVLSRMRLLVVPVTSTLLFSNCETLTTDIIYAKDKHIPILPIMMEPGLVNEFTKRFGTIQFLDKTIIDPTAISYERKLESMLTESLVKEEITDKIKNAFDAFIFLSYRKKDREYANKLMHLIHENPNCEAFAFWYDEYLVPGEEFNQAIKKALENSDLFVLSVTPNLVNEENYVQKIEYPMARELNKTILPIEMVSTDKNKMNEQYAHIPSLIEMNDTTLITDTVINALKSCIKEQPSDSSEHSFFLGLAYLGGISVERDEKKALKLIKKAAEGDLPQAYEKLAIMYRNGDGAKQDLVESIKWLEKLFDNYKECFEKEPSIKNFEKLFSVGRDFAGRAIMYSNDYKTQAKVIEDLVSLAQKCHVSSEKEIDDLKLIQSKIDMIKAIDAATNRGNLDEEENDLWSAKDRLDRNNPKHKKLLLEIYSDLLIHYGEHRIDEDRADYWGEVALNLADELYKETGDVYYKFTKGDIYTKLGRIKFRTGSYKLAKDYYEFAEKIFREVNDEQLDKKNLISHVSIALLETGRSYDAMEQYLKAKAKYEEALSLDQEMEKYFPQSSTVKSNISTVLGDMAINAANLKNNEAANKYAREAYEISKTIFEKTDSDDMLLNFIAACDTLGSFAGDFDDQMKYLREMLELSLKFVERRDDFMTRDTLTQSYFKAIDVSLTYKNYDDALELAKKAFDLCEKQCQTNPGEYTKKRMLMAVQLLGKALRKKHPFKWIIMSAKYIERSNEVLKDC